MESWTLMSQYLRAFWERFPKVNFRDLTCLDLKTSKGLKDYFVTVHDFQGADLVKFPVRESLGYIGNEMF